jgi:hypothetical protein
MHAAWCPWGVASICTGEWPMVYLYVWNMCVASMLSEGPDMAVWHGEQVQVQCLYMVSHEWYMWCCGCSMCGHLILHCAGICGSGNKLLASIQHMYVIDLTHLIHIAWMQQSGLVSWSLCVDTDRLWLELSMMAWRVQMVCGHLGCLDDGVDCLGTWHIDYSYCLCWLAVTAARDCISTHFDLWHVSLIVQSIWHSFTAPQWVPFPSIWHIGSHLLFSCDSACSCINKCYYTPLLPFAGMSFSIVLWCSMTCH